MILINNCFCLFSFSYFFMSEIILCFYPHSAGEQLIKCVVSGKYIFTLDDEVTHVNGVNICYSPLLSISLSLSLSVLLPFLFNSLSLSVSPVLPFSFSLSSSFSLTLILFSSSPSLCLCHSLYVLLFLLSFLYNNHSTVQHPSPLWSGASVPASFAALLKLNPMPTGILASVCHDQCQQVPLITEWTDLFAPFLCLRHRRWCRRHHVFGLSVRTSVPFDRYHNISRTI